MQAYRVEKVIAPGGKVVLDTLPFATGAVVEIIVLGPEKVANNRPRSTLKGSVIKYDNPFAPVAEDEWEALQ